MRTARAAWTPRPAGRRSSRKAGRCRGRAVVRHPERTVRPRAAGSRPPAGRWSSCISRSRSAGSPPVRFVPAPVLPDARWPVRCLSARCTAPTRHAVAASSRVHGAARLTVHRRRAVHTCRTRRQRAATRPPPAHARRCSAEGPSCTGENRTPRLPRAPVPRAPSPGGRRRACAAIARPCRGPRRVALARRTAPARRSARYPGCSPASAAMSLQVARACRAVHAGTARRRETASRRPTHRRARSAPAWAPPVVTTSTARATTGAALRDGVSSPSSHAVPLPSPAPRPSRTDCRRDHHQSRTPCAPPAQFRESTEAPVRQPVTAPRAAGQEAR